MVGARLVVGEARVAEPMLLADHPRPAAEHRPPDHRRDDPAVPAAVDIGRRVLKARLLVATRSTPVNACSINVALAKAIAVRNRAPSTFCPCPVLPRSISAANVPKADKAGGAEIDPRHFQHDRLLRRAGEVDRAAHRLADAVKTVLVRQRPAGAKPGHGGQDDVGLDLAQAVEIERQ